METEIWKDVIGYEGLYQINNLGVLKSSKGFFRGTLSEFGYLRFNLCKNKTKKTRFVHNLVMNSFIGKSNGLDVNHKNGIKTDNRLDNLEYCTRAQNIQHSFDILNRKPTCLGMKGYLHWRSKKVIQYSKDGCELNTYGSLLEASRETGIIFQNISKCCNNERNSAGGFIWEFELRKEDIGEQSNIYPLLPKL